jgi:hypothetical protein
VALVAIALAIGHRAAAQDASGTSVPAAPSLSPTAVVDAPPRPDHRLFIENLSVEGPKRASVRRIVAAESRLVAGREYGEIEIRDAVRRVKRLPFVLDARPTLRRGTSPGRYELVIEIEENAGVAFTFSSASSRYGSSGQLTGGVHTFVGGGSRVTASFGGVGGTGTGSTSIESATVGFEQYDIAGHGSRLELQAIGDFDYSGWHSSAALIVPLSARDSLTFGAAIDRFGESNPIDRGTWGRLSGGWLRETTDDPFAPLQGTRASASVYHQRRLGAALVVPGSYQREAHDTAFVAAVSDSSPLARGFALELRATAVQDYAAVSADNSFFVQPGASLRWVHVARRNRSRLFVEGGIDVTGVLSGSTPRWIAYAAGGFHNKFALINLRFSYSLNGYEYGF